MINYNRLERIVIANFFYAYDSNTFLIEEQGLNLIDVLDNHNFISDAKAWKIDVRKRRNNIRTRLGMMVRAMTTKEQLDEIMHEYKTGIKYGKSAQ